MMSFGVPRRSRSAMSSPVSFAPLRTSAASSVASSHGSVLHVGVPLLAIARISLTRNSSAAFLVLLAHVRVDGLDSVADLADYQIHAAGQRNRSAVVVAVFAVQIIFTIEILLTSCYYVVEYIFPLAADRDCRPDSGVFTCVRCPVRTDGEYRQREQREYRVGSIGILSISAYPLTDSRLRNDRPAMTPLMRFMVSLPLEIQLIALPKGKTSA